MLKRVLVKVWRGSSRFLRNLWKLTKDNYLSVGGSMMTLPGAPFELFRCHSQVAFFGFIDLRSLGPGDSVEISLSMSLGDDSPAVSTKREYSGPVAEPFLDFPNREASNPILVLRQLTGVQRPIKYKFLWREV